VSPQPSGIVVGVLDAPVLGYVAPTGGVALPGAGITIDWAYYTDSWHEPVARAVRQVAVDGMPVVESRVAVPSGDVVHRVYATAGSPPALVIEIENASPAPIAVSLTVPEHLVAAVPAWREVEHRGGKSALVWPLPHRATVRAVVPPLYARSLPGASDVVRGWVAQLERGARFEVDDEPFMRAVDGSRAALLLLAGRDRPRPSADDAVALEDWGFDVEALAVWQCLSMRERRRASRRGDVDGEAWARVRAGLADAPGGVPARPARFLRAVHDAVIRDGDDTLAMFPGFPPDWLGQSVAFHDVPARRGLVSVALRWHGDRPALLWTAPEGVLLTAPALAPDWSLRVDASGAGETLLAPPPDQLLRLATAPRDGDPVDDPGSFS
jgi:hypothetical protein